MATMKILIIFYTQSTMNAQVGRGEGIKKTKVKGPVLLPKGSKRTKIGAAIKGFIWIFIFIYINIYETAVSGYY